MCEVGAGYHDRFKPTRMSGVCDVCGSREFVRRADDNRETVMARLEAYHRQTTPTVPHYQAQGRYHAVDGMAEIEDVTRQIQTVLEQPQGADDSGIACVMAGLTVLIIRHAEKPDEGWPGLGLTAAAQPDRKSLVLRGWQGLAPGRRCLGAGAVARIIRNPILFMQHSRIPMMALWRPRVRQANVRTKPSDRWPTDWR